MSYRDRNLPKIALYLAGCAFAITIAARADSLITGVILMALATAVYMMW
jgi:hypothetical protein